MRLTADRTNLLPEAAVNWKTQKEKKYPHEHSFDQPEAEMEAVVRCHLHWLITGSNNIRTEGRSNIKSLGHVE